MSYKDKIVEILLELSDKELSSKEGIINYTIGLFDNPVYACSPEISDKLVYGRLKEYLLNSIIKVEKDQSFKSPVGIFIPVTISSDECYLINGVFIKSDKGLYYVIDKTSLDDYVDGLLNY